MGDTRGMRDYDIGIWFLIESNSPLEAIENEWTPDQMKQWFPEVLRKSELQEFPIAARVRDLIKEWARVRRYIPVQAREVLASGLFKHVNLLRAHMYCENTSY